MSKEIRAIEPTLAANDRPVAVGLPGYILPMDLDGKLFLATGNRRVTSVVSEPAGALNITAGARTKSVGTYVVQGKRWGRARLVVNYSDGSAQSIHYYVTKPGQQAVTDMGNFLTTKAWYTDESDPFHRAPSPMTYDRANNRIVLQDTRAWVAGLSDEGGTGSWLAAMMKEFGQPNKAEIDKLSQFVDKVIWGNLQYSEGPRMYGVRRACSTTSRTAAELRLSARATGRRGRRGSRRPKRSIAPTTIRTSWRRTGRCRLARELSGLVSAHRVGVVLSTRRSTR